MKKLNVDVWADGDNVKEFKFSDGYQYTGADANKKMLDYFKEKSASMQIGAMRIHDWEPIAINLN